MRRAFCLLAATSLVVALLADTAAAPVPAVAEPDVPAGVAKIKLPAGTLTWKWVDPKERASRRPTLRLTVGQTVVEADRIYFGDGKMATCYEATDEGIHWASPTGKKAFHNPRHDDLGAASGHHWSWEGLLDVGRAQVRQSLHRPDEPRQIRI
jgi:hypothetical protein